MSAPQRHSDFVGDLCEALAHRRDDAEHLFMILTAYFDESGTHDADITVMAGFVGDARQWRKFEKRARKLFGRYRVDVFHMIDVRRTRDAFAGWKVDRKIEFLDEFVHITNETLERGYACLLRESDYQFYCSLDWPKGTRRDSKYGILFRASLASVVDSAIEVPHWSAGNEPRLHIVLESGHRNAPDAVRLYELFRQRFGAQSKTLAGLTFASKKDCLPLASADMFAYSAYGHETGAKPIGVSKKPIKSDASYQKNLYRIEIGRPTLIKLHAQALAGLSEAGIWRVSPGQPS